MASRRVSLSDPIFAGRFRASSSRATYKRRRSTYISSSVITDISRAKPSQSSKSIKPRRVTKRVCPRLCASNAFKHETVNKTRKRRNRQGASLTVFTKTAIALLFIFGIGVGINGVITNNQTVAKVQALSKAERSNPNDGSIAPVIPDESSSPDATSYKVAANRPRLLIIPKIGVEARVTRIGVNAKNQLGTPPNIFDAGWYDGSSLPGEAGASLIDGHVSGPTKHGVFFGLKELQKGDKIYVERGDGTRIAYSVAATRAYAAEEVDMAAVLTPIVSGRPGLNLITCTGALDKDGTHYNDRLVVFAVQE